MQIYSSTEKLRTLTNSRKKKFSITKCSNVNTASYWDSGSISHYRAYNFVTNCGKVPPSGEYPNYKAQYELLPNEIVICTGIFLGKEATPKIFCRSEDFDTVKTFFGV